MGETRGYEGYGMARLPPWPESLVLVAQLDPLSLFLEGIPGKLI